MITTPLRVFNEITIHKLQGLMIGPEKYWDNVAVTIYSNHTKTYIAIDMVELSRSASKESFFLRNDDVNGFTVEDLK